MKDRKKGNKREKKYTSYAPEDSKNNCGMF